jgi:hypothetical protein
VSNPFWTVYLLVDPLNGDIRYVGCTKFPVNVRLQQHLHGYRTNILLTEKEAWILGLREKGLKPLGYVLLEIEDPWEAYNQEKTWIRRLKNAGCPLTSIVPYGQGNKVRIPNWTVPPAAPLTLWPPVKLPGLPQWRMQGKRVLWRVGA